MYRFGEEEIEAAAQVMRSGQWFRYGDREDGHLGRTTSFEEEWAKTIGTAHAGFVSSGTAALMCCCAGLEIGPGDEVIVPGYTWIATATVPLTMGAIPVIVDVDESLTIDPAAVEAAVTPRTKAVICVHMSGFACDLDRLRAVCDEHGLALIEDACQCDGGWWTENRRIGSIGDMSAFSFNQFKVIGCGDSGIYVADDEIRHHRALVFHDSGITFRDHAAELKVPIAAGLNLRGNEILAAIMRVQLSRLDGIVDDLMTNHREISRRASELQGLESIPYNGGVGHLARTGTGATIGFRFGSEDETRSFIRNFTERLPGSEGVCVTPADSGRHVYINWGCVLEKRAWHTEAMNPFNHPANTDSAAEYHRDMLPRTLDLLRRTAYINVSPDWDDTRVDEVSAAIEAAAGAHIPA